MNGHFGAFENDHAFLHAYNNIVALKKTTLQAVEVPRGVPLSSPTHRAYNLAPDLGMKRLAAVHALSLLSSAVLYGSGSCEPADDALFADHLTLARRLTASGAMIPCSDIVALRSKGVEAARILGG